MAVSGRPGPAAPATAVAAGVLALLGALFHLIGVVGGVLALSRGATTAAVVATLVGNVVLVALLAGGALLLLTRRPAGRVLVAAGSGLAVLLYVLAAVFGTAVGDARLVGAAVLLLGVPALATLVLATVPATGRWLAEGPASTYPPPGDGW
ncbi:hypothetical protein SAMN05421810_102413 [Amycolatopsis arida]|uniref:Integral membrane protein n=1 Tax=Amycolatopsis arida TaxID=587909 RepID=A0A1I5PVA2_9PSEU|nr:hypothetical protein [Amycolatopsis arida]TDX98620.1 hypothetical protein CLV69_101413 [Amycolatopsis arida]SFP38038.1 hypothetical protein SAMN05421810_102413 [Amycolatopsis arida]